MLKRILLLLAALLWGCDDPAAGDRAANILEHGLARARAVCASGFACFPNAGVGCGYADWGTKLDAILLQDGMLLQQFPSGVNSGHAMVITTRGEPVTVVTQPYSCELRVESNISAGVWTLDLVGTPDPSCSAFYQPTALTSVDIETECTGFNLEAFGELP